jgi:two-component system, cell cycle sensor histidine kinase and response regulator CckA
MANLASRTKPAAIPQRQPFAFFRSPFKWLFSQKYFHFKLLSGTAAGALVIILLAGIFLYVTLQNHYQDAVRMHTIGVMRLGGLVENDIATMESAHRGYLLTGNQSFLATFDRNRDQIRNRIEELTSLILDRPAQRKRIMKVKAVVEKWIQTVATPQMNLRQTKTTSGANLAGGATAAIALGNSLLDQAREVLQSLQDEEQIVLNQRMHDQEWAIQSTQIIDFVPKLERAVVEMEKEKRGYLLTGETNFVEAYKRAATDFYSYNAYLSILVASSPGQAQLLAEIRANVERWIETSAGPEMDAKRAGKEITDFALKDSGEALMGDTRQMLANFAKNELNLYELRSNSASRERIVRTSVLGALAFLAVALLVVSNTYSFAMVRRHVTKVQAVETRISSIMENILDGMITVDQAGVIRSMNPAASKMFGCRDNEMLGNEFTRLIPKRYPDVHDSKPIPSAWEDVIEGTGSTTLAVGRTRKNIMFPVEISLSQMTVDHQLLYVAMVRDVTERKRFEQEIAAEKESLGVTLRSIGDGVITTDVHGKIVMINKEAERLTGWTSGEAVGQPLKSVFNVVVDLATQAKTQKSGSRSEVQSILQQLPENVTLTSRDGVERVIEQVASPICDNKNEVTGVVLVFRDITERQRNEAERRKAETLEQLGLLAGGIAHDFNNLLTAIIGNISLVSLVLPSTDEMASQLNDAKNASMRARDLAQQLLTFARGGAPIKKAASIAKLIQDTVSFSLRGSHNRSSFNFGADLWPAEVDTGQISQVVANLVVNADQAMPNGGALHVSCENFRYTSTSTPVIADLSPGDYIRISIRDEGVGIPEKYLKRIFDPYFTTKPKGTGLGLATAYSIIKNHNGLMTVESEVHVGSTFNLYIPAALNQEIVVEQPRVQMEAISGTGRVLIVDDEEAIRALVDVTLTRLGYEVAQAETALEGVNLYQQKLETGERFDLVILDLTLPGGMGGKEALKRLIEIDPTVNAIVSSGYATDATMSRYQDFGFRGVIAKPYEAAELAKTVHDVISSSHVNIIDQFEEGRLATRVA